MISETFQLSSEAERKQELNEVFSFWATKNGFNVVAGTSIDSEGRHIETGMMFNASLNAYEIAPPASCVWDVSPETTKQGILLREGILEESLKSMKAQAYSSGEFRETGGTAIGLRCVNGDFSYAVAFTYLPLPIDSGLDINRNSAAITFTPTGWSSMCRAMDRLQMQHDLSNIRLGLPLWIHCHPGVAFESDMDRSVHRTNVSGWYGLVVGNDLLNHSGSIDIELIRKSISQGENRQLATITDNGTRASVGLGNQVGVPEHFLGLDSLQAYEFPLATDPILFAEDFEQGEEEPAPQLESKGQVLKLADPDKSEVIHISLLFDEDQTPKPGDAAGDDLIDQIRIISGPKLVMKLTDEVDITITIEDVTPSNLEKILDKARRMLGF
ncbi:MAG: hypothetical protein PVJ09_00605 [Candidatus Woesebacteria bacterium]|jgi:hypothetical protein